MSTSALTAAPPESPAVHRRIDPPHATAGLVSTGQSPAEGPADDHLPAEECPDADGSDEAATVWSQMRTQAHQLADALRRRQQELERREANLHAQSEQLEQETRSARLWWQTQLEELARRDEELSGARLGFGSVKRR